jgi:hypothetical protein
MEEEKYRIPLFDGNSYPDWKFSMTVYLDELDLLSHTKTPLSELLEEYPEPENIDDAAEAAVRTARNGLIRNDKKCKSRIIGNYLVVYMYENVVQSSVNLRSEQRFYFVSPYHEDQVYFINYYNNHLCTQ